MDKKVIADVVKNLGYDIITVTRDVAMDLLRKTIGNRKINKRMVQQYAGLMLAGKWKLGDGCLAFDTAGKFANGHHRMYAFILAAKENPTLAINFLIRYNVSQEELMTFDTGIVRNLVDAAVFDPSMGKVDTQIQGIAYLALTNGASNNSVSLSNEEKGDWVNKYRKSIDFVISECFQSRKVSKITTPAVLVVFVLADINGVDRAKLKYAANCLMNVYQAPIPGFKSLDALRRTLERGVVASGGGSARREIFFKTQHMLYKFLNGDEGQNTTKSSTIYFYCIDAKPLLKNKTDPEFLVKLSAVGEILDNCEIKAITVGEILVYKLNYTGSYKHPQQSLAEKFGKTVKENGGQLDAGSGVFFAIENGQKKVMKYRFVKGANKTASVATTNINEDNFNLLARKLAI